MGWSAGLARQFAELKGTVSQASSGGATPTIPTLASVGERLGLTLGR